MTRDRTGEQHGALTVLGRDEENPRRWRVRWGCCGKELVVGTDYVQSRTRTLPTRCRACVVGNRSESKSAVTERERKQKVKGIEAPGANIYAAGLWWGAELGRLGPR